MDGMSLAKTLLRTTARAFYTTEHVLVIDALCLHSTLPDGDLAHILGMQTKYLRKLCGKLREDGMLDVHTRGEKRQDAGGSISFNSGKDGQQPKERIINRDWYYLHFHHAIDSLKFKLWKLSRHIESLGAPTTEKKDLICPRCKSTYTELEVMDNISMEGFLCHKCGHVLNPIEENEGPAENESMKRMNDQLSKIVALMRQIDSTNVPENNFDEALALKVDIQRSESNPGPKTETIYVESTKQSLASTKGLVIQPEKISVSVSEGPVEELDEAAKKREKAAQNMLPDWISRSTINGAITSVGAKEAAEQAARNAHLGLPAGTTEMEDEKRSKIDGDSALMDEYWRELKAAQEREAAKLAEEEEEDDEDEDDFEDVAVPTVMVTSNGTSTPAVKPTTAPTPSSGAVSSNATDDERETKRMRLDGSAATNGTKATDAKPATEAAKDADSDEDELDFEDV